MIGSLARLAGTQAMRVENVLGGRTVGARGALLHVRGTSLGLMATKVGGGADFLYVRGDALDEMATLHGRADACGLMIGVGARGSCCQGYQGLH